MTRQELLDLIAKYNLEISMDGLVYGKTWICTFRNLNLSAVPWSDEEDFVVEFFGLGMSIRNPIAAENRLKVQILSIKQQEEQKKLDDIQKDFE
jgi:hypothetical protein